MNTKTACLTAALLATGCDAASGVSEPRRTEAAPVSTNELMVSLIDLSAKRLWNAGDAASLSSRDWLLAEQDAVNLIASGVLITQPGAGPRDAEWAGDEDWQGWTNRMQAAAMAARFAIEHTDQSGLVNAGAALQETCAGCHAAFMPDTPTGGLYAVPLELSEASAD